MRRAVTFLSGCLLLPAACAMADGPDPVDLIRKSITAEDANGAKAQQYAYREYKTQRGLDRNGKETDRETQTWDVIGLEGSTYRKLVMKNDKPLPPKEQKREDERLRKETELRKKETPEQRRNRTFSFSYSLSFNYNRILDIFDVRYVGEERVEGRRTYVIEGTPKPDFRPTNDNDKEMLNYRMRVWLVQDDFCFARTDWEVIGDHSRMQQGSQIRIDHAKNGDGVWLPTLLTFRYTARFFKMMNVRGEMTAAFSDYHKFQVDSRVLETEVPH
jgi:hypothetical protein